MNSTENPPAAKIKVIKIELTFSESPNFTCPKVFNDLEIANGFIWREHFRATQDKASGKLLGYFKTDFTLTFEDGETYSGRFDIGSDARDLSSHVIGFCEVYGGIKKPAHMTPERWEQFKKQYEKHAPDYRDFLNKYDLGTVWNG